MAYPLAQVALEDPSMPVSATLEAMNPLVKGDAEASGMPVALLRWRIANTSAGPLRVTVAAAMPNPCGGVLSQEEAASRTLRGIVFRGDADKLRLVEDYAAGSDKSPTVGGLLGIVPGLGYAYSGEWSNMVRSMVLNGLFGWAMFECADREEWGLFAVTTFFELTWYTGSIYGGIDAAHRYNRERLENAAAALRDRPVPSVGRAPGVPLLGVRLEF